MGTFLLVTLLAFLLSNVSFIVTLVSTYSDNKSGLSEFRIVDYIGLYGVLFVFISSIAYTLYVITILIN